MKQMASISQHRRVMIAKYVVEMLAELRSMGKQINADVLVYLLEMAMIEASAVAKEAAPGIDAQKLDETVVGETPAEKLAQLHLAGKV